jgi:hypothetical protein
LGKIYPEIDQHLSKFIQQQPVFFVATAPLSEKGHINVSPKGLDSLRILGPRTVGYLDVIGSGVETIAHVKENGRIALMFCAFQGPPRVLRLHGRARVLRPQDPEFAECAPQFPLYEGTRSIIVVAVTRISTSCGYAVPLMKHESERAQYTAWAQKKGPEGLKIYVREKNARSIDELTGLSE